jgi:hypothetical protein
MLFFRMNDVSRDYKKVLRLPHGYTSTGSYTMPFDYQKLACRRASATGCTRHYTLITV